MFVKGKSGNYKGRKKGSPNKITSDVRKYILDVADKLEENKQGLYQFAEKHPEVFWTIFAKLVPKNVNLSGHVDVIHQVQRAFGAVEAATFIPALPDIEQRREKEDY
jgi:hypothetical protein